jgi:hypothetical protein
MFLLFFSSLSFFVKIFFRDSHRRLVLVIKKMFLLCFTPNFLCGIDFRDSPKLFPSS